MQVGIFLDGVEMRYLDQLGVENDLGIVGEELGDWAARLGVAGSRVKGFLGCAGNAGRGGQRDLGDGEPIANLGQRDGRVGLDLFRREARAAQLRAQSHGEAACVGCCNQLFGSGAGLIALKPRGERVVGVAQNAGCRGDGAFAFFQ